MQISKHAKEQAKKRFGWTEEVLKRKAKKALRQSPHGSEMTEKQKKIYTSHGKGNNPKYWAGKMFVFQDSTLLSVYEKREAVR